MILPHVIAAKSRIAVELRAPLECGKEARNVLRKFLSGQSDNWAARFPPWGSHYSRRETERRVLCGPLVAAGGPLVVPPEPFKPIQGKRRIAYGVLYVRVAEVVLDGARVVSVIRQLVAGGVPENVRVCREPQSCVLSRPCHQLADVGSSHRSAVLRAEHVRRVGVVPPQLPQRPQLGTAQAVRARYAALESVNV